MFYKHFVTLSTVLIDSSQKLCLHNAAELEHLIAEENCSVPRIWFDMLTHAERLRVVRRDDRELAAVRRLMKKTNEFMFSRYMEKIGGRR